MDYWRATEKRGCTATEYYQYIFVATRKYFVADETRNKNKDDDKEKEEEEKKENTRKNEGGGGISKEEARAPAKRRTSMSTEERKRLCGSGSNCGNCSTTFPFVHAYTQPRSPTSIHKYKCVYICIHVKPFLEK